jgi:hypothetical protein
MADRDDRPARPRALQALAAVAGLATLALLGVLVGGSPDLIARLPAWVVYTSSGTLFAALVGLELAARGGRVGALRLLAKIGFGLLVVIALFLLAQVLMHP